MNQSNHLRIETVRSARQRADFYRVRKGLYANDPSAVIPLRSMEWAFLDPAVHPFYGHARREVFVAYRGNRPVGRIAAIVDDLPLGVDTPADLERARALLGARRLN